MAMEKLTIETFHFTLDYFSWKSDAKRMRRQRKQFNLDWNKEKNMDILSQSTTILETRLVKLIEKTSELEKNQRKSGRDLANGCLEPDTELANTIRLRKEVEKELRQRRANRLIAVLERKQQIYSKNVQK